MKRLEICHCLISIKVNQSSFTVHFVKSVHSPVIVDMHPYNVGNKNNVVHNLNLPYLFVLDNSLYNKLLRGCAPSFDHRNNLANTRTLY